MLSHYSQIAVEHLDNLDHRYEMVEAMAGSRSKTRRENPPVRVLEYPTIRIVAETVREPLSGLRGGVKTVFTIDTEAGEMTCVPRLHILGTTMCS